MTELEDVLSDNICIYYNKNIGMLITADPKWYKVYFKVNDGNDFEYVNSYSVGKYSESKDFSDIILGAHKLADLINKHKVSL